MADLPHLNEPLATQGSVNIDVDGRSVSFGLTGDVTEYVVSSLDVRALSVSTCMKTLHNYTLAQLNLGSEEFPLIDLAIRLDEDRGLWEPNILGVYIWEDIPGGFGIHFTINSAIGLEEAVVKEVVNFCLTGTALTLRKIEYDEKELPTVRTDRWRGWNVFLCLNENSRLLFDDLLRTRLRISQEIFFPRETLTMPYLLLRTLQMGNAESLIGQAESEWLEVKSVAYELQGKDETRWKTELAQDVSQFANSPDGGLLLIGFRTKKMNGIDSINKITPIPRSPTRRQVYGDTLKRRVHPPISGLQIGEFTWGKADIVYIYVPPQQDENRPYLVTGAIINKCDISIVRRQGADCIPVTAQEIHAALVIGRAAIRKQQ